MRRVLIVTYDFPPGLSGVRRIVKFAKYLPEFGYQPVVVCARPDERMPLDQGTLREVVAQGYPVVRTASLDPYHVYGAGQRLARRIRRAVGSDEAPGDAPAQVAQPAAAPRSGAATGILSRARALSRWIFVPDDRIGWLPLALPAAWKLLAHSRIDAMITTSYPNSTHMVGRVLRSRFRVPWLCDFRDGWSTNPYFANWPTRYHQRLDAHMERSVATRCDAITTVSEPIATHLATIAGDAGKVHVIPNGYDPEDFANVEPQRFDRFTIAYTGTLFMQRSPADFFLGLRRLLDRDPSMGDSLQVLFMTRFQEEHERLIAQLCLGPVVRNLGLGPYHESLRLQVGANALLALEAQAPNGEMMLTQKIFEYMAARRPVLAVAPEGALADVVRNSGVGIVVPPDNIDGIADAIAGMVSGNFVYRPRMDVIESFHRRALTGRLAAVLEQIVN